jgi:effector-binding domain-containing protein
MRAEVTLKTVEATPTAVVRSATTWAEFPNVWGPMLDQVWSFLRGSAPRGLWTHGHNVMLYTDDVPNVEIGVQVTRPFDACGSVVPSTVPGGLVAAAIHSGPVARIGDTHEAVRDWLKAHGSAAAGPRWEIYGDPDPSTGNFTVEVMWLVAGSAEQAASSA